MTQRQNLKASANSNISRIFAKALVSFTKKERQDLGSWAEDNMILNQQTSALVGKWRSFEYQKEILSAATDPNIEKVTIMKSARIGYTKILCIYLAYIIDQDPSSVLIVQPTLEDAENFSKDEIVPMLSDVSCLKNKVHEQRSRNTNSTILKKQFIGGALNLIGANSPRGFRAKSCKRVMFDEIDGYPVTGAGNEGDQIKLGEKRALTFADRKFFYGSTPTYDKISRIKKQYDLSDKRKHYIPCPSCSEYQTLEFPYLKWNSEITEAWFNCKYCGEKIQEKHKLSILEKGEWRKTKPDVKGHAGFHVWVAYSPIISWREIAKEFMETKNNPELLKTFVNTVLGETWEDKRDAPDWQKLFDRKEEYERGTIPDRQTILTCGVDVQKNRIEAEIVAWGMGMESWSIDYLVFPGSPLQPEVWQKLKLALLKPYDDKKIRFTCIDSGYATQHVRLFVRQFSASIMACILAKERWPSMVGNPRIADIRVPNKKTIRRALEWYPVSNHNLKSEFYEWLKTGKPGPCYCHFPQYDNEYFKQLTSHYIKVVQKKTGFASIEWNKTQERDEALSCRLYARAAAYLLGIDKWTKSQWVEVFKPKTEKREKTNNRIKIKSRGSGAGISFL